VFFFAVFRGWPPVEMCHVLAVTATRPSPISGLGQMYAAASLIKEILETPREAV